MILLDAGERVRRRVQREALGEGRRASSAELGVTVREGARATAIDARGVTIEVGGASERIASRTVIWAAGVHAVGADRRRWRGPPGRAPTAAGGSRSTRT